jgi:hypothetical protein
VREPSIALSEGVKVSARRLVGTGLERDAELLRLSAYSTT